MKTVIILIIATFIALIPFEAVTANNAPPPARISAASNSEGTTSLASVPTPAPLSAATTSMADIERLFAAHCKTAQCKPMSMRWLELVSIVAPAVLLILGYMTGLFDRILSGIERISRKRWLAILLFSIAAYLLWQWSGKQINIWVQDYYQSGLCKMMVDDKYVDCSDIDFKVPPKPYYVYIGEKVEAVFAILISALGVGLALIASRFVWTRWTKWGWLLAIPAFLGILTVVESNKVDSIYHQVMRTQPLPDTAAGHAVRDLAKAAGFPVEKILMTRSIVSAILVPSTAYITPFWHGSEIHITQSMFNECDEVCVESLQNHPESKEQPFSQGELLFATAHEIAHAQLNVYFWVMVVWIFLFIGIFALGWWGLHRWDARRGVADSRQTQLTALIGIGIIAFYGSTYLNNMNVVWQEHRADERALEMTNDPDGALHLAVRFMKRSGQLDWPFMANLFIIDHPDWRWRIETILDYARDNPSESLDLPANPR